MSEPAEPPVETVIEPIKGIHWIPWRELHAYRDLLWLLIWRDTASRYKQTVLGPLWYIIQPIATTAVFMIIFARVGRIPTNSVPSSLFYMCGLLPWNYFAQTFQTVASSLVNNSAMFSKVYFPRLIVPIAAVLSNLVGLLIQLGTFLLIYFLEKAMPRSGTFGMTAACWLLPLIFLQVALLSLGTGLWVAALTTKFRDIGLLAGFVLQLLMYASPVVFPLTRVPARWYWGAAANPMTFPIEAARLMLLKAGTPTAALGMISIGITLSILATGLLIFQRVEKNFVDVI